MSVELPNLERTKRPIRELLTGQMGETDNHVYVRINSLQYLAIHKPSKIVSCCRIQDGGSTLVTVFPSGTQVSFIAE